MSIRIREILDGLKGPGRRPLLKYIPSPTLPTDTKGLFPNAIISSLPYDTKYSIVGLLSEDLVLTNKALTSDSILEGLERLGIILDITAQTKIQKSKTTTDYINKIQKTREILTEKLPAPKIILQDQTLNYDCIEGHPDGICGDSVIEVKTTANLEENINYFMLQLCGYIALGNGQFKQALLVLPLQQTVLAFDMRLWYKRVEFRNLLVLNAKKLISSAPQINEETVLSATLLVHQYNIGQHIKKAPTLLETVKSLPQNIPYQIFMGGNQNTRLSVKDGDIAAASDYVAQNSIKVYVHSPYLINLSAAPTDEWNIRYMEKLLQYSGTLGAKGVVVHTGKHTTDKYDVAVEKMRKAIQTILPYGTARCPLLLETPAGQGTETLQKPTEFLDFVESFRSQHIAVCVDTCHVFANGHDPLEYIKLAHSRNLLRLVHFNDSQDCCGSCKDRHAAVGMGQIGIDKMTIIAQFCNDNGIDMLIE